MSDTLEFQITDIVSDDIPDGNKQNQKQFLITIYGIDKNNDRVVVHVKKYNPYFYIKIPWNDGLTTSKFLKDVCGVKSTDDGKHDKIYSDIVNSSPQPELCNEFYGLQWNIQENKPKKFYFAKLSFKTHDSMKKYINLLIKHYNLKDTTSLKDTTAVTRLNEWRNTPTSADCNSNLYESSIHPIIRFIHDSKIEPTGWISIKIIEESTYLFPKCKYDYHTNFKDVKPLMKDDLSDYRIASFDIECDSLHGDFPQAKKNFKKLSADIFDSLQSIIKNCGDSRKADFTNDLNSKILKLLKCGFNGDNLLNNNVWKYASINKLKTVNDELPVDDLYNDIIKQIDKTDICEKIKDLNIKNKDRENTINQLQDIIESECDKIELRVEGDPIIQIGTVFYDYSSKKLYRHILVIGDKTDLKKGEIISEEQYIEYQDEYGEDSFSAAIGAEAIEQMLLSIDLENDYNQLKIDFK